MKKVRKSLFLCAKKLKSGSLLILMQIALKWKPRGKSLSVVPLSGKSKVSTPVVSQIHLFISFK